MSILFKDKEGTDRSIPENDNKIIAKIIVVIEILKAHSLRLPLLHRRL